MKTRKTLIAVALAAAGVAALSMSSCSQGDRVPAAEAGQGGITADYPSYTTLEDVVKASDAVVVAEFVSSKQELSYPETQDGGDPQSNPQSGVGLTNAELEEMAVPVTVSKLKVTDVLKGDVKVGDTIEVSQLGGTKKGAEYLETHTVLLKDLPGKPVVLLLAAHQEGPMDLINPETGLMVANGDKLEPARSPDGASTSPLASSLSALEKAAADG